MVTFRGDERYEKMKEYKSIPYGFLKLLGAVIVVAILIFNSTYFGHWLNGKENEIGTIISITLGMFIMIVVLSGSRLAWIMSYFSKNVRGFIARYWIGLTETGEQVLMCDVMRRGEQAKDNSAFQHEKQIGAMMIEIPLGGWFKRPRVTSFKIENPVFIRKWKVRLIKDGQYTYEVQLRFKDIGYGNIYEDRATLSLSDALLLLSRSADNFLRRNRRWDPACIGAYLLRRERELEEVIRKNNEDRESVVESLNARITELEGEVTRALGTRYAIISNLEDILRQLKATTRLRTTLEGIKLRVSILEILIEPKGYEPTSTSYIEACAELAGAREELEKLSRRRSGRRGADAEQAAPPAPTA